MDLRIKCEHMTSDMTVSLNYMLLKPTGGTYLGLMEDIRKLVMQKMVKRVEAAEQWDGKVAPNITKKIIQKSSNRRDFLVKEAGDGKFEVFHKKEKMQYIVDLRSTSCNCGYWQLSGIPCVHVISCIGKLLKLFVCYQCTFILLYLTFTSF